MHQQEHVSWFKTFYQHVQLWGCIIGNEVNCHLKQRGNHETSVFESHFWNSTGVYFHFLPTRFSYVLEGSPNTTYSAPLAKNSCSWLFDHNYAACSAFASNFNGGPTTSACIFEGTYDMDTTLLFKILSLMNLNQGFYFKGHFVVSVLVLFRGVTSSKKTSYDVRLPCLGRSSLSQLPCFLQVRATCTVFFLFFYWTNEQKREPIGYS